jgi:uncharacterized protein YqhQ
MKVENSARAVVKAAIKTYSCLCYLLGLDFLFFILIFADDIFGLVPFLKHLRGCHVLLLLKVQQSV